MILRKGGASLDQQITELSEYTTTDPDERWLYELARYMTRPATEGNVRQSVTA